ncbi:MAG: antibiotic biosynthesis monooxygenase [Actinomycetota bacterium]|nr:antibiotic biosynthesis monooxygenase [Actinomycetota bacterium]
MEEPKKEIARYGKATANSGEGEALGEILLEAAGINESIEGCLQYDVYRSVFDPDVIWVTELWTDQSALDGSLANKEVKGLIARARPLIKDMEVVELVPLGGLGDRLERAEQSRQTPREASLPSAGSGYTHKNLSSVDDLAPAHGMGDTHEARFAAGALGATQTGLAHFRLKSGQRQPFGHTHGHVEEVYYVIGGSGRIKLDDEILDLEPGDFVRIGPEVTRAVEAGSEGMEFLAFGPGEERGVGGELKQGWWTG